MADLVRVFNPYRLIASALHSADYLYIVSIMRVTAEGLRRIIYKTYARKEKKNNNMHNMKGMPNFLLPFVVCIFFFGQNTAAYCCKNWLHRINAKKHTFKKVAHGKEIGCHSSFSKCVHKKQPDSPRIHVKVHSYRPQAMITQRRHSGVTL